jgi:hypothetical protein
MFVAARGSARRRATRLTAGMFEITTLPAFFDRLGLLEG